MAPPDDLSGILDRIANGEETEGDRQLLRQLLREQQSQSVVQLGKYTVNLGQGREIQVGDRIYQGTDAETIKTVIQAVLQHPPVVRSQLTPQEYRNRQALLNKVKNFWVQGVLETSLHHQVIIQLGLEDRSHVLATPWNLVVETADRTQTILSQGTTVLDLFDRLGTGRTLLILGEPGAGKTITLLQLTRELIARAEQDMDHLIPVVFNLSTWSSKWHSLADWLVAELNTKYQVPKAIAQPWVTQQQLLLLLDGLDEVRAEYRDACVVALNQFEQAHGTEMVVCSRIKDYERLSHRLTVQRAIYLRSLTPEQVDGYLSSLNIDLTGLRELLAKDTVLQELVRSPLMLNIMVLAYEGVNVEDLPKANLVEEHRQQLFNTYIDRMLKRRLNKRYSPAQIIKWLSWLANQLSRSSQTIFLIERMQPDWCLTRIQNFIYRAEVSLVAGLGFGLGFSLIAMLSERLIFGLKYEAINWAYLFAHPHWTVRQIIWLIFGLIHIPMIAILVGILVLGKGEIKTVENLKWSWKKSNKYLLTWIIKGAFLGLIGTLINRAIIRLVEGTSWEFDFIFGSNLGFINGSNLGFINGLTMGLIYGLTRGLGGSEIETKMTPNQGIWMTLKSSIIFLLAGGIVGGTVGGVLGWVMEQLTDSRFMILEARIIRTLSWGMIVGFGGGGGLACIQHLILRLVFWRYDFMPWNYARFLDHCCDRIFLQKVGGGYIFIHRLLMEHFAAMQFEERGK